MTQYAFQKEVLTALQELKKSVGKIEMTYETEVLVRLQELKHFVEELKKFNEEQKGFNEEQKGFNEEQKGFNNEVFTALQELKKFVEEQKKFNKKQEETNKRLEISYDGLSFMVENEVITRLDAFSDRTKLYADRKIQTHEEKYKHALAA
ncbi:hypothetical protein HZA38_00510 [Candidatus Peregrinibacteria bacterium]|nr:hypothetical protein [Candidatus Peregrinibacteria bacterium]